MSADEIIPLTKRRVPTVVGFDTRSRSYTIGDEARLTGLNGKTTVFNFKPAFGAGDKEFSKDKKYWYWVPEPGEPREHVETFSAKEAATRFLQTLFANIEMPEKIIMGEPAIRDQTWRENFRRHVREVFDELKIQPPEFFPEPFAVFQYYRHVEGSFPVVKEPEIVLIIDIGGSTFNSCIIRTTEAGLLARGGATALPLGLQAELCGGSEIDKELFKVLVKKASNHGIVWKEDPLERIKHKQSPALLHIEDAKIRLSEEICKKGNVRLADDFSKIAVTVTLPKGDVHPDSDVSESLTGEDLKDVIREMWRRHYGKILCDTVNEARAKLEPLKLSLEKIDKILIAGGSSRLPFMKEEIHTVLPTQVEKSNIFAGADIGEAVAYGIACECREQAKRDPKLTVGKMAPCILNDLYLGFRHSRRDPIRIPRTKHNGAQLQAGQLLSAPFETEESILKYEVELPFEVGERIFYSFSDKPLHESPDLIPLNLGHDVFSVPQLNKVSIKCELELKIQPNGMVKPTFWLKGKGSLASKQGVSVNCPEFYFAGFRVKEGKAYVGFDFGNSNSYLVKFVSVQQEVKAWQYPEFKIRPKIKDRLQELEIRLVQLHEKGSLTEAKIRKHAEDQMLEVIFHSNKIEGSPLLKGETEAVLLRQQGSGLS
jgi:hypothetical protein